MRLTRRDALAALAAAGVGVGGSVLLSADHDVGVEGAVSERQLATLVAAAEVLYPSDVEGVAGFVERYVRGRSTDRPEHAAGMAGAASYLDAYAEAWEGERFAALGRAGRDETLRRMDVGTASPDPDGSDAERVRYYVVNELLFALYATPTGGELVGVENPPGFPGGLESYQRGPGP